MQLQRPLTLMQAQSVDQRPEEQLQGGCKGRGPQRGGAAQPQQLQGQVDGPKWNARWAEANKMVKVGSSHCKRDQQGGHLYRLEQLKAECHNTSLSPLVIRNPEFSKTPCLTLGSSDAETRQCRQLGR